MSLRQDPKALNLDTFLKKTEVGGSQRMQNGDAIEHLSNFSHLTYDPGKLNTNRLTRKDAAIIQRG